MRLYSTPSMVRDIEYTCLNLIQEHLDESESSVGIHVAVDHLAATPLGQWVDVEVTVSEVDGRKVTLLASVRDAVEEVGRGEHVRFVIDARSIESACRRSSRNSVPAINACPPEII